MSQPVDDDLVIPSAIYRGDQRVRVHFTPCTLDQPEPVAILYLLHGAGADETQWSDVGVFDAADTAVIRGDLAPTVIVLPDALPTFSCAECASNYRHHLLDEIEPRIAKLAPLDTARRAIGGISRGGGMALRVAGAHPGDFVAVGGHSSVDVPADTLAAVADARLPVRLDAGHDDSLLATSQQMARALESDGGDVELVESHGGHDRPYWRDHVTDYIAFYAEHLGASSR
ncbi:MAG: alpha/beta hydrolase-fold protein [Acidimicrobiales bacterium]|nr:alpha/beta hydrolase-fold protein [Acidimicrobiales bacterium]